MTVIPLLIATIFLLLALPWLVNLYCRYIDWVFERGKSR